MYFWVHGKEGLSLTGNQLDTTLLHSHETTVRYSSTMGWDKVSLSQTYTSWRLYAGTGCYLVTMVAWMVPSSSLVLNELGWLRCGAGKGMLSDDYLICYFQMICEYILMCPRFDSSSFRRLIPALV